jgi:hypothetical protein
MFGWRVSFAKTHAGRRFYRHFPTRFLAHSVAAAHHANVGIALASLICLNRPDLSDRLSG